MTGFLAELGKKLADRWVALLVLPGVLFTAVAAAALILGQRHWADTRLLADRLGRLMAAGADRPDGLVRTVLLLVGLLLAGFASGLLARALGTPVEHGLAGRWPRGFGGLAGALTRRRRRTWARADERCRQARDSGDRDGLGVLVRRRNDIALTEPRCPTWIGDRLAAPALRVRDEYGLDLSFAWSRLWLLLPESTRAPLTEGRRRLDDATALGGWALLYLVLGAVWWPAAVAGAAVWLVAWRRSRAAAGVYADLVEAAVDVHVPDLLERFADDSGVRPARPQWGAAISERFRKGV
jgi:hypothetical protein